MSKNSFSYRVSLEGKDKLSGTVDGAKKAVLGFRNTLKNSSGIFSSTSRQIGGLEMSVKSLRQESFKYGNQRKLIEKFYATARETDSWRKKLEKSNKALDDLRKTSGVTARALNKAESDVRQANKQFMKLDKNLTEVTDQLERAGIETNNLSSYQEELANNTDIVNKNLGQQSSKLAELRQKEEKRVAFMSKAAHLSMIGQGVSGFVGRAGQIVGTPVREIAQNQRALSTMRARILATNPELTDSKTGKLNDIGKEEFSRLKGLVYKVSGSSPLNIAQVSTLATELGKSGVSASEINEKNLRGLVNTSIAGEMGASETVKLTTSIANTMGLSKKTDLGRIGDMVAAISGNSAIEMSDLPDTFKNVGAIAKGKLSLEELSSLVAVLGQKGINRSVAGTAIKNAIINVSSPTTAATKALSSMNVETTDEQGNIRKTMDIIRDIMKEVSSGRYTEKELEQAFLAIGGRETLAGFKEIVGESNKEFEKMLDIMKNAEGYSAKIASHISDDLTGDVTDLSSKFGVFKDNLIKPLVPIMRSLVQATSSALNSINGFMENNPTFTKGMSFIAAGLSGIATAGISAVTGIFTIGRLLGSSGGLWAGFSGILAKVGGGLKAIVGFGGSFLGFVTRAIAALGRFLGPWGIAASVLTTGGIMAYDYFNDDSEAEATKEAAINKSNVKSVTNSSKYNMSISIPEGANPEDIAGIINQALADREEQRATESEASLFDG